MHRLLVRMVVIWGANYSLIKVVLRAHAIRGVDTIVVATTLLAEDRPIVTACRENADHQGNFLFASHGDIWVKY